MLREYSEYCGKFDSPMACYVFEVLSGNGDFGEEEIMVGEGEFWASRYGKRVLSGYGSGFVYLWKAGSVEEAVEMMQGLREEFGEEEEEEEEEEYGD